ncbi:MAG: hypothetical protein ACE5J2_04610 [Nitrososphaerales archaeon]
MSKGHDTEYKKKEKNAFNGIMKLASLLQKALDTGRSNYVELSEISRYVIYYVKTQADDSSICMDYILNNYNKSGAFQSLRTKLVELFNKLNETTVNGYEKLVAPNGSVNKNLLEQLIQIDAEITDSMNRINNVLKAVKNNGEITDLDIKEIEIIASELRKNVGERKNIVK